MSKNKTVEMRIYETLGVKSFRKIAFAFRDKMAILDWPTSKMSKEERKDYLYSTRSNYNLGKVNSLEDLKKYKKRLFSNTCSHVTNFLMYTSLAISSIMPLPLAILCAGVAVINLYGIMLQRYNCIRINRVIKKMEPHYERQKEKIKEELRKSDSSIQKHSYKIIDRRGKETDISFEDSIKNATIEELRRYREYLSFFVEANEMSKERTVIYKGRLDRSIPMGKNKMLRIELKRNNR